MQYTRERRYGRKAIAFLITLALYAPLLPMLIPFWLTMLSMSFFEWFEETEVSRSLAEFYESVNRRLVAWITMPSLRELIEEEKRLGLCQSK